MSRLAMSLFSMFVLLILLRRSPEFFKCERLIVPNKGVNILVMCFTMLGGAVFIPEIIGRRGMLFLCVLESP